MGDVYDGNEPVDRRLVSRIVTVQPEGGADGRGMEEGSTGLEG